MTQKEKGAACATPKSFGIVGILAGGAVLAGVLDTQAAILGNLVSQALANGSQARLLGIDIGNNGVDLSGLGIAAGVFQRSDLGSESVKRGFAVLNSGCEGRDFDILALDGGNEGGNGIGKGHNFSPELKNGLVNSEQNQQDDCEQRDFHGDLLVEGRTMKDNPSAINRRSE